MGFTVCCTNRAPPSPDGFAPRPAIGHSLTKVDSPPTFVASISTIVSRLSNPSDAADLQAIFEDEKSSIDGGLVRTKPRRSANAVHAVADRLKKRLSRDLSIANSTKRHLRSSVGSSEEEVERRAELRRIRQKRIEDELSCEIYDDDAKSLSTILGGNSTLGRATRDGEYLPTSSLTTPTLTFPTVSGSYFDSSRVLSIPVVQETCTPGEERISLPSPHDYALSLVSRLPSAARSDNDFNQLSQTKIKASFEARILRRHSFPKMSTHSIPFQPGIHRPERIISAIPPVPICPVLQTMRLPSITDPASYSSWRISFTVPNRGEHLRKLSGGYVETPLLNIKSPNTIGPRPLNKWLHSQGYRSSSQAVMNSEDSSINDCVQPTYLRNEDFGGVDGSPKSTSPMHLYKMAISQLLSPSDIDSSSSLKPLFKKGSQTHRRFVSSSAYSQGTQSNFSPWEKDSDMAPHIHCVPDSQIALLEEEHYAFYDSGINSVHLSRNPSSFDLSKSTSEIKGKDLQVSKEPPSLPPTSSFSTLHLDSLSAVAIPLPGKHDRFTADSSGISETDSHRQLEAELKVVQTRFTDLVSHSNMAVPLSSKFHEEFELEVAVDPMLSPPISRQSSSALINERDISTFDGTMEKMLGVPLPPATLTLDRRTNGIVMNGSADDLTLGVWGKAVLDVQNEEITKIRREKSIFAHTLGRASFSRRADSKSKPSNNDKNLKREDYDTLMAKKDDVMENWEQEMEETAKRAKARSNKAARLAKLGPDRRYPTSWSRYPSFDRKERTEQTKIGASLENVERRDFAVHATDGDDTTWYRNEQSHHLHHHDDDDCAPQGSKSIFKKMKDKVKYHTPQIAIKDAENVFDQTFGRKGSITPSVPLKFPELEVLAVETNTLMNDDQIEEHVEKMIHQEAVQKKEEDLQRKEDELDAIFGGPRRLGKQNAITKARKAAEVKKAKQATELAFRGKTKRDQFGMKLDELSGLSSHGETNAIPESSKNEKKIPGNPKQKTLMSEEPVSDEEELDTAGMNRVVLAQQIAERSALKKKIEGHMKAGGPVRRGPVARAIPQPGNSELIPKHMSSDTLDHASPRGSSSPMDRDRGGIDDILSENNMGNDSDMGTSLVSIADPMFYQDCIAGDILNTPPEGQLERLNIDDALIRLGILESLMAQSSEGDRIRTWNGVARYRHGRIRLVRSTGDIGLRKSEDFMDRNQ